MSKSLIQAMLLGKLEGVVYVTPVRQEGNAKTHYSKNWHQDWYEQSDIPEWIKLVSGWNNIPQLIDGEEPLPIPVTFERVNDCIRAVSDISWGNLPAGTYYKICGRDSAGELLWEINLSYPVYVNLGELIVHNIGMEWQTV